MDESSGRAYESLLYCRLDELLTIIAGIPCAAMDPDLFKSWKIAKRLYFLMQKYQFDRLQHWFPQLAMQWCVDEPIEALCLACSNPCFDQHLVRATMLSGFRVNTRYFYSTGLTSFSIRAEKKRSGEGEVS